MALANLTLKLMGDSHSLATDLFSSSLSGRADDSDDGLNLFEGGVILFGFGNEKYPVCDFYRDR